MTTNSPCQLTGDKLKKSLEEFSSLLKKNPGKPRSALLKEVEIRFDLSPRECEFLNTHFNET